MSDLRPRHYGKAGSFAPIPLQPFDRAARMTDVGNARRFAAAARGEFLYCGGRGKWFVYDGRRWQPDYDLRTVTLGENILEELGREAWAIENDEQRKKAVAHALRSLRRRGVEDMIALARADLPVSQTAFDTDPFALNCANGTIDLRTGDLRPHDPADLITRLAPVAYDPDAQAPRFKRFLREILVTKNGQPDEDVIAFVQAFLGYATTADVREDLLLLCHGGGRNGKTTLFEAIASVLGDYAQGAQAEVFLDRKTGDGGSASPQIARLAGARLVMAAELPLSGNLAENLVKSLTGGDTQTARFLHAELFDFEPTAKFILRTNNKPRIRGTDPAIWDRIGLVPFNARFAPGTDACDSNLKATLELELPGILRWLIDGAISWHQNGLPKKPDAIVTATAGYREEQDTLARFLAEKCTDGSDHRAKQSALYRAYKNWCSEAGEDRPLSKQRFNNEILNRGLRTVKSDGIWTWIGIGLAAADEHQPEDDRLPL